MARHQRAEEHEEHEGGMERWLLTYADMITLLLALFVVLFALSTVSVKKFEGLAASLKNTFSGHTTVVKGGTGLLHQSSLVNHPGSFQAKGPVSITTSPHPLSVKPLSPSSTTSTATATATAAVGSSSATAPPPQGSQSLAAIAAELNSALGSQGLSTDVRITPTPVTSSTAALVVRILADKVFYAVDSASLGVVGNRVVDTIASVLRTDTNNAVVQGYTDNQPIYGGRYATNWELSAARAVQVVVRLNRSDGIVANRLSAIGYGHTRPLVPNTTPANQAENRRVDVVILAPGRTQP